MLNQAVIVGRIYAIEDDRIIVNVQRSFKNESGEYDSDAIPVLLTGTILDNTRQYCHVGDVVGIKGRLETSNTGVIIKGEKVTFLSSRQNNNEGGEEDNE